MAEVAELQIDIRIGNLERKLAKADLQIRKLGRTADATGSKVNAATAGMAGGFKRLGTLIGLVFGVRGILGAINVIKDFETSMSGVRAVTGATDTSMKALRDTARDLGAVTAFSATEAAKGMEFLGMAGFETDQIIAAIPATLDLAAAGMLDLGQAADIASNILSGFALPASEMGRVSDVLATTAASANTNVAQLGDAMKFVAPIAAALNVPIEDVSAAVGSLSNAGIQGGEAGTTLRRVMLSLLNPSREATSVLESYGLSLEDVNIKAHGFIPVLQRLTDAQIEAGDAAKIFEARGVSGFQALTATVRNGEFDKLREILSDVEGSAKEMARIRLDNLAGDMRLFKSALDEVILSTGDAGLGGALRRMVQGATEGLREIDKNFNSIERTVLEVWDSMSTAAEESVLFVARAFQDGANFINGIWETIRTTGEVVFAALQNALLGAIKFMIGALDKLLAKMQELALPLAFLGVGEGLTDALSSARAGLDEFNPDYIDVNKIVNAGEGRAQQRAIQQNLGVDTLEAGIREAQEERTKSLAENLARQIKDDAMKVIAQFQAGIAQFMGGPGITGVGGAGVPGGGGDDLDPGGGRVGFDEDLVNRFGTVGVEIDELRERMKAITTDLNDPFELATMSTDEFGRKMEELAEIANEVERQLATNAAGIGESFAIGFNRAIDSFGTFEQRVSSVGESLGLSLEANMTNALVGIVDGTMSVKEAFANMAQAIVQDLIKVMIQQLIVKSIMSSFGGGGGGGGLAAVFHEGGQVGGGAPTRSFGAGTFTGRSKFEDGGLAGDEVPIIAHRGEEILTEEESKAKAAGGGGGAQNVEIMNVVDPRMVDERISQNPSLILNIITSQKNQVRRILGS
jgi:TP901 family phage tail tape measure protein